MKKQTLSIEQMQHLKELGVDTSKAKFYWHRTKSLNNYDGWDEWELHYGVLTLARGFTTVNCEYVRTFTLQDILDLLPDSIEEHFLTITKDKNVFTGKTCYKVCYKQVFGVLILNGIMEDNLIDAAYEMLCWVIKNGYLKVK